MILVKLVGKYRGSLNPISSSILCTILTHCLPSILKIGKITKLPSKCCSKCPQKSSWGVQLKKIGFVFRAKNAKNAKTYQKMPKPPTKIELFQIPAVLIWRCPMTQLCSFAGQKWGKTAKNCPPPTPLK